jgi:hypothetical protein
MFVNLLSRFQLKLGFYYFHLTYTIYLVLLNPYTNQLLIFYILALAFIYLLVIFDMDSSINC